MSLRVPSVARNTRSTMVPTKGTRKKYQYPRRPVRPRKST